MDIRIVSLFDAIPGYLDALRQAPGDADALWEAHVVAPHWPELCCYAPFPLDGRKPAPCRDAAALERQLTAFSALNLPALQAEFARIAAALPNYDDDPITAALCPHPAGDADFIQRQNGVVGTSLFGNLLLCVDPLAPGWQDWLPYVFAHEYHHTVWGNYWYSLHGGALTGEFVEALVIDGLADDFAMHLYPALRPQWVDPQTGDALLDEIYLPLLRRTDVDYPRYMFGGDGTDLPWCAGYAAGAALVRRMRAAHHNSSPRSLLETPPQQFLPA